MWCTEISELNACGMVTDKKITRIVFAEAIPDWKSGVSNQEVGSESPSDLAICIKPIDSLQELVYNGCIAGLSSETPHNYIDWDSLAHDLRHDYSFIKVADRNVIYRAE